MLKLKRKKNFRKVDSLSLLPLRVKIVDYKPNVKNSAGNEVARCVYIYMVQIVKSINILNNFISWLI